MLKSYQYSYEVRYYSTAAFIEAPNKRLAMREAKRRIAEQYPNQSKWCRAKVLSVKALTYHA